MRLGLALLVAALSSRAAAACSPAEPERAATDAEFKAQQAESIAVRSGNPGAQARAAQARDDATSARQRADALQCKGSEAPARRPLLPGRGY